MTKETKKKRLNLRELINNDEPIWVENMTGRGATKRPGPVMVEVGSGTTRDNVVIPPGADPVCITDQVDPESIRRCKDLFKLTSRGTLKLLNPEKADEYYENNEKRRKIVENKVDRFQRNIPEAARSEEIKEQQIEINAMVMQLCLELRNKKTPTDVAIEKLIENEVMLTVDDLTYLTNSAKNKEVKAWAQERLTKIYEAEEKLQEEESEEE